MKHILRAIVGPQAGAVIVLGRRATLGRAADCDIQIVHEGVSRKHAKFSVTDAGVVLADLSSDNGTFVNDTRIVRQLLQAGDSVRVMDSRFVYEVTADEAPVETAAVFTRKVTSGDSLRRTGAVEITQAPIRGARGQAPRRPKSSTVRSTAPPGVVPRTPIEQRPMADRATPPTGSPTYEAGSSGMWRRSIEPDAARAMLPSDPALPGRTPRDREPTPPFGSPSPETMRRAADAFSGNSVVDAPPVTSGSGAFRRSVPGRGRGEPITGRYGAEEVRAALEVEPERIVPPAARGGSVAVPSRAARPTAEVARHDSALESLPDESAHRFQPPGTASGRVETAEDVTLGRRGELPRTSADPRAEPDAPGGVSLPPGWVSVGPSRNAVDRVEGGVPARPPRGIATTRGPTPTGRPPAASRSASGIETGEYAAVDSPRASEYDGASDPLGRGTDERAMEALAAELNRRTRGTPAADDPHSGVEEVDAQDGRSTLSAVLQYRDFRLRTLQGGRLTAVERRRYDHLDRYLKRTAADGDALAAMRRFARFSCELPAELVHSHAGGTSTLVVAVYDLGAGGARLDVGGTGMSVGDMVWLSIDLEGVNGAPTQTARRVVFKSRVVWTLGVQLGVSFSGAPKYEQGLV